MQTTVTYGNFQREKEKAQEVWLAGMKLPRVNNAGNHGLTSCLGRAALGTQHKRKAERLGAGAGWRACSVPCQLSSALRARRSATNLATA